MKWPTLISLFLLVWGCSHSLDRDFHEVQADSCWSVRLPGKLKPSTELHEFAPIQFWDKQEAFFVVGLSEKKADMRKDDLYYSLEDYIWFVQDLVCAGKDSCSGADPVLDECGTIPCMNAELYTQLPNDQMEVIYRIRVCEGTDRFYQLISWTVPAHSEKHRTALDSIFVSLRELSPLTQAGQASAEAAP